MFLFLYLCHSVSAQIYYSIFEEMQKDSSIGNLVNDLGLNINEISLRKLRIVSEFSTKYFNVKTGNGHLVVADRIDREALCGAAEECFLTFDAVIENPLNIYHVRVDIKDINDNPPRFKYEIIEIKITEHTSPGVQFALRNAEDLDVGINSLQSYKLSANKHFVLGEKANTDLNTIPELVLMVPLDRETEGNLDIILTAFDGGNPMQTGTAIIRITVVDINDNIPKFDQEVYKVSINENIPMNSTILQVKASDKDEGINSQITYSFTTTSQHVTSTFAINSTNGEIKTKENLDFEMKKNYEISVQALDGGGLVSNVKVFIQILDENDNTPDITVTSITDTVSEDSAPNTVVALIKVHDLDSGENGEVDCQIIGTLPFKLQLSSGSFYKVVTTSRLDREIQSYYNITIQATDHGSPPLSFIKTIALNVSDINDNPPIFEKELFIVYLPENNQPGASIYTIQAMDKDTEENGKLTYSIISTEELPFNSYITINPVSGIVYAQQSFDFEQYKQFEVHIMAKDKGSPSLNSSAVIRICVTDQNDNLPTILYPSPDAGGSTAYEMVPFSSEQGSLVTKVVAVDADSGHNAWLSYHLLEDSETSYIVIDQNTGVIRTARIFQERHLLKHRAVVIVKDNGFPPLSATVTLNLIVTSNLQQALPELSNPSRKTDSQTNVQIYLVIAIAVISFFFLLTVMSVIISKYRESKSLSTFSSIAAYPQIDPSFFPTYNNGTLSLPYSYDVCVTLDPRETEVGFLQPNQHVAVKSLIDEDNLCVEKEMRKDSIVLHYSIVEEMRKDSIVTNIAQELGLHVKELVHRNLRIVSRVEKYFSVDLETGNLFVKDRIDRETLCRTETKISP
ncbi:hypothetical protein GDO86_005300 [Hymenochirus boettgeri]|uniref:Cadherin domain-containing protein n=1 Tax=Hymenochirus boettgeri TaxID=247094 RepID=A0A8T2J5W2_9PIPI|nr:hypothetical protein GDO86_005300 [Hymenochirus boettgeri]